MFQTPYNNKIADACLALNRRKIDNLEGIESGDSFEGISKSRGAGDDKMSGGRRNKHKNTREEEYAAVSSMDILPRNTNIPDNSKSTLNSNRYLPIKQSGSFQTPNNVLQFYQTGGIQGSGIGEAEIEKIEGGNRVIGSGEDDRDVVENLAGRMSELSGFGKPSMFKLLNKLKKKLKGRGFFDSVMSGLNLVAKHLPTVIEHAPTVLKHAGDIASFLGFGRKGKKAVLDTKLIEHLAQMGAKEFKTGGNMYGMLDELLPSKTGSGIFSGLLGMFGLGKSEMSSVKGAGLFSGLLSQFGLGKPDIDSVEGRGILSGLLSQFGLGKPDLEGSGILSGLLGQFGLGKPIFGDVDLGSDARFLSHGEGKVRKIRRTKKGGYDINIETPLPVIAPIEDLRGTIRPKEGGRKVGGAPADDLLDSVMNAMALANQGGKKKGRGAEDIAVEGGAKLSKAKIRGLAVAKIMKERGVKLGEASKIVSEGVKKHGAGWFDDVVSGFSKVLDVGLKVAPLFMGGAEIEGSAKRKDKGAEGGAKLSKAKIRGLAVAKIMKEKGCSLGQASKIVSEGVKKQGSGFFNDLLDGIGKVVDVGTKVMPFFL
jgi:hypothetical protein